MPSRTSGPRTRTDPYRAAVAAPVASSPVIPDRLRPVLERTTPLAERFAASVHQGQAVEIAVDGTDVVLEGTVRFVAAALDADRRTLTVEAVAPNEDGRVRAGHFARARLRLDGAQRLVAVPKTALRERAGVRRVYVVVDGHADARIVDVVEERGDLAYVQADLPAGAHVVVDNTFATPLLQQPLRSGADIVVHSATKYLSGHSDVLLGALVTADDELFAVLAQRRELQGCVPGTLEAWLATRGMRTLHLRVERAQANAMELARRLGEHPAVGRVRYPGFGCIVSIELAAGPLAADLLTRKTNLWVFATSLGGVESSLERRRRHAGEPASVPDALVRLSVGVEDVDDLWRDLDAALRS